MESKLRVDCMEQLAMCSTQITCLASKLATVETLVCGRPQGVKKVSTTGAGHLRECKNTLVVWEWG